MRTIPLTQGKVALVSDEDYPRLMRWKWCATRQGRDRWRAARGQWIPETKKTKLVLMHRAIMAPGDDETVDHVDGDPLNNRRSNLRIATQGQQCLNRRGNIEGKTSLYKGVYWQKDISRWRAKFRLRYLGTFIHQVEAAKAYDRAALEFDPGFACLNFPVRGGLSAV